MAETTNKIVQLLAETWPARMAQSAWQAFQLPGDVYAGRIAQDSPDYYNRAGDLASMMVGSPGGAGGLGSGMRKISPERRAAIEQRWAEEDAARTAQALEQTRLKLLGGKIYEESDHGLTTPFGRPIPRE